MILNRPYVQPVCQICSKDTIEIAINLFSMAGLVDVNSITWLEPDIKSTPRDNVLTYNKDSSRLLNWGLSFANDSLSTNNTDNA